MLHNEVASSSGVFYEAFCGDAAKYEAPQMRYEAKPFQASCFFALNQGKKNGGESGIRTRGESPHGGFQDRCLKPLDHLSAKYVSYNTP